MKQNASSALAEALPYAVALLVAKRRRDAAASDPARAWPCLARPEQLPPPGDWRTWLLMGGRGSGKTRAGLEWARAEIEAGRRGRLALVAETAADVRDVLVEGPSGLLAIASPGQRPRYELSKRRLSWPNGAVATTYSADDPEQLRGPEHDGAICDEIGKWARGVATWDNLQFGLRIGPNPVAVAMTTPRRVPLLRTLLADPRTAVAERPMTTADNAANLSESFVAYVERKYAGTRLGRQELGGELLDDVEGALWSYDALEAGRVAAPPVLMRRVVVGVDPPAEFGEDAAECGIVVAGLGMDGRGYVLADLSKRASPATWASAAVAAYEAWSADRLVAEVNNGGAMVEHTIRTVEGGPRVAYRAVRASRGKQPRAEPVSALYESGRVSHVGLFAALEDQLCTWTPDARDSPDRLDALVWAFTDLMLGPKGGAAGF